MCVVEVTLRIEWYCMLFISLNIIWWKSNMGDGAINKHSQNVVDMKHKNQKVIGQASEALASNLFTLVESLQSQCNHIGWET